MNYSYIVLFVISLILLIGLVHKYSNRISVYYVLVFSTVVVMNFGYMQLATAENMQAALYANQITYLGTSFMPIFMLMCIADLCKTKLNKWLEISMHIYAVVIFSAVSTIGYSSVYYKTVELQRIDGISFLAREYGPLHIIYPVYLVLITTISAVIIFNAFRRNKEVSYVVSYWLLAVMMVSLGGYVLDRILGNKINCVPYAAIITLIGIMYLLRRISLYEVTLTAASSMVDVGYGFVICDNKGRYLGSDEVAKGWFPELKTLSIDVKHFAEDTELLQLIGKWIRAENIDNIVYLEKAGKVYEIKHTILKKAAKPNVHCIYLRDDTKQQQYTKLMAKYNEELEREVEAKASKLFKIQNDILISMASIVENRDSNTGGHIARTSDVVKIFVEYLQKHKRFPALTKELASYIIKAAPLHDFGKIAVPDVILNKPGKFTDEEYEIMKQHSAKGAVIVEQMLKHSDNASFKKIAVNVAHFHHEKWDGRGYPTGIAGAEIPFEARVMALADVFDALVSKRVYKDSFSYDRAFDIIKESNGSHFDPVLGEAFLECRPQLEALYNSYTD